MAHVIEAAATGRAKCRGCGGKIAALELRFGEGLPNPFADGETTYWFHLDCAAFKRPEPFLEALAERKEPLEGSDLKEIRQELGRPRLRLTFRHDERVPRHSGVDSGAPVASPDGRGRRPSEGAGMRWSLGGWVAAAVLFFAGLAGAGEAARLKKPRLGLRASPRVAFSPVEVLAIAELKGGQDVEEFYCPGLEWDWGDGSRSAHESDCAPFQAGTTLDRFFTARHSFRAPGAYSVRLTLRRADRTVAVATVPVTVYGHSADLSDF